MKYLLLIYQTQAPGETMDHPDLPAQYAAFSKSIQDSNHYLGGNALRAASMTTTVRLRDGKTVTTDGPFVETREQLAGYYLIEAAHLDDAIGIAARIPSAKFGTIEVRPVYSQG